MIRFILIMLLFLVIRETMAQVPEKPTHTVEQETKERVTRQYAECRIVTETRGDFWSEGIKYNFLLTIK